MKHIAWMTALLAGALLALGLRKGDPEIRPVPREILTASTPAPLERPEPERAVEVEEVEAPRDFERDLESVLQPGDDRAESVRRTAAVLGIEVGRFETTFRAVERRLAEIEREAEDVPAEDESDDALARAQRQRDLRQEDRRQEALGLLEALLDDGDRHLLFRGHLDAWVEAHREGGEFP